MTLQAWIRAGWLRPHDTQSEEIRHLWEVSAGDLRDAAAPGTSAAVRFEYAYNAALKCCIMALYAGGMRPGRGGDVHHRIIRSLPLTLGSAREVAADYLDACRERRDRLGSEAADEITEDDVAALLDFARAFHEDVRLWLDQTHPAFTVG